MTLSADITLLREHISAEYPGMFRAAGQAIPYPFLTPGSDQYADHLWDWDSWLTNVAIRQILLETEAKPEARERVREHERGCILNWLHFAKKSGCAGWVPILVGRGGAEPPADLYAGNMHKPCLAQHAAFLVREDGGDAEWLRADAMYLQYFLNNYRNHHRHPGTGLYFWQNDNAIGVDNDPATYGRPPRSSGSIYLNSLLHREFLALAYILDRLGLDEAAAEYRRDAGQLQAAVQAHCWDERDGFFYSVDLNLEPNRPREWRAHAGELRPWPCLIQRLGVWSGFHPLWSGLATGDQAARVVENHYKNPASFHAPFGVRTLDRREKMYSVRATGNPSSWLGPIWGVSNYLVWRGLVNHGYADEARDLADKTITLFANDLRRHGALHEYYQPENGEPVLNCGFQNWNYLVLIMAAWREERPHVTEF